jgi:type VI secretion system protein ImpC
MAETQTQATGEAAVGTESAFSSLLKKNFRPATDEKAEAIEGAVGTLCDWALRNSTLLSDDTTESIKALIAVIDQKLSDQINQIMHNEQFQKVESAWRGLH